MGKKQKKEITVRTAWLFLLVAGLMEIYWATSFKTDKLDVWTMLAILLSFDLLIRAVKKIPIGTAYATFTGIGTIGTIFVDMFYFHEPFHLLKIVLILLLAAFIVGLKFTDSVKSEGEHR